MLILRRLFGRFDDEDFNRTGGGLQPKAELFL